MTNEAYALSGQKHARVGGVIIAAFSLLATFLVIAGLTYALGTSERNKAALAAAGCEPNLSPSGLPCTTEHVLAGRYTTMTTPIVEQLNTDIAAYTANERHHLAAAKAALTAEVTLENEFAAGLARFPFAPAMVPKANALVRADRTLAVLTATQARSSSLAQLRSFDHRVKVAGTAVQGEMELVSTAVTTIPTANEEP